ncbi:MED14 [Blepharisma stoltei]|uniref:Mediator of RNA polymerase II transcription subunit 14 n=1 Tax=Blepharisma stoltei TaxID=1481888 RepID=A0AAU9IMP7_9CILI|nr:unnamed protein product [Blepharisma stoltei]
MEVVKLRDLIRCISQHLARELHELTRAASKRHALVEYCSRTRSLLKRLKKVISWSRSYAALWSKIPELQDYLGDRSRIYKETAWMLGVLHSEQLYRLRTPRFALTEASDILCRGEYRGFPLAGSVITPKKVPLSKLTQYLKHKTLLVDHPAGLTLEVADGKLNATRNDFQFSVSLREEKKELLWMLCDFQLSTQQINVNQKNLIFQEMQNLLKPPQDPLVLVKLDTHLKRTCASGILENLQRQAKQNTIITINYIPGASLKVSYWPQYYPSYFEVLIKDSDIVISHSPPIPFNFEFTSDFSGLLDTVLSSHRIYRLQKLIGDFADLCYNLNDHLEVFLDENCTVTIDFSYFSGASRVELMGEYSSYLSETLNKGIGEGFWAEIREMVFNSQLNSVCRCLDSAIISSPLRFSKSFYNLLSEGMQVERKEQDVLGYIEIGQAVPTDAEGSIRIFAVKISKLKGLKFDFVVYINTELELCIDLGTWNPPEDLKECLSNVIKRATETMTVLKIPFMLSAKPELETKTNSLINKIW